MVQVVLEGKSCRRIVLSPQSFLVIAYKDVRDEMECVNPRFITPGRTIISRIILDLCQDAMGNVMLRLKKSLCRVSLTEDAWF